MSMLQEQIGDFKLFNYAENFILAYPFIENEAFATIAAAGSVTLKLQLPYAHRLVKMVIRHTDGSNVASIVALDVQIKREAGSISVNSQAAEHVKEEDDLINENTTILLGEGFEYEASTYSIKFTTTAAHHIHLLVYLQRLGARR